MLEVEAWLHSLGYKFTGPGNLYGVTFIEIHTLSEGTRLLRLTQEGVTVGEQDMLDQFAERLG
jgi:hypothetical protein